LELGVHLPLMEFSDEGQSLDRLTRAVDAARECGLAAVSANDHFLFQAPWLDGPTALAAVVERSGSMELATTVALVSLRGPTALAKTLAALDVLSGGRVVAGVGPGSSERNYAAAGIPWDERWPRFEAAVTRLRELLGPDSELAPPPRREGGIPLWLGSWGSPAGLRRVARLGAGWFASAYNTSPPDFAAARDSLADGLRARGREPETFPNALVTMWTWITDDAAEADSALRDTLAPMLRRDPEALREQLCVGPPERCAELLSRYAEAGCKRVHIWPLGDEPRQIERAASEVLPTIDP
jgi:alkanesulfonate monooxygenase SsuD/methylene tetrahydromethanopterin reductase-like flavin-dependent oxidoreductase (luciferase family)